MRRALGVERRDADTHTLLGLPAGSVGWLVHRGCGRLTALPLARSATELRSLAPYTPQHIHRLEKAGRFPKRPQLGPNRVGWRLTDIEAWINERLPAGVGGAQSDPDAFAT